MTRPRINDHILAWAAGTDLKRIEGYQYARTMVRAGERIVLEGKPHCPDPYTHTNRTNTDEVTIDWGLWQAIEGAPKPLRLAVAHDRGIWMHVSDDVRRVTPGDRNGGRGGNTRLAWFRWDEFKQVWPAPKVLIPEPDILEFFK